MVDSTDALMLATVRVSRGLTQSALAAAAKLSQATVSKVESGLMTLPEAQWVELGRVLDAPVALLMKPAGFAGMPATVFHRKRASLPVSVATRLRASLDLLHLQVAGLVRDRAPVRIRREPLDDDGYTSPEDVAEHTRATLSIPRGPIHNLVDALEKAGVVVVSTDLGSAKIDALMSWPPDGRPIVLLGTHAPGDRQRFSIAHELGHAIMHALPTQEQEQEADRFAAEFLMPRVDIEGALQDVSMPTLARLKPFWGVSMSALLRRAHTLGCISDYQYRQGSIELSRAGYRTREPVEIPTERPNLLEQVLADRLSTGEATADIAAGAWMTEVCFRSTYLPQEA